MRIEFDGHAYTPEDIEALRQDLIVYRDRAIDAFPAGIEMAMVLSHAIGVLNFVKDEVTV
jgi:hypothetical protein